MPCDKWEEIVYSFLHNEEFVHWDEYDEKWYVQALSKFDEGVITYVPLHYCPFCGEEIDKYGCKGW